MGEKWGRSPKNSGSTFGCYAVTLTQEQSASEILGRIVTAPRRRTGDYCNFKSAKLSVSALLTSSIMQ